MNQYIKLEASWKNVLAQEFERDYMQKLDGFLKHELQLGKKIYPATNQYFNALNLTPFDQVKVVILGQDPYHGEGQAHGLCFSVPDKMRIPPSLKNIYKELKHDLGCALPHHGCLEHWASQGVLLLNSVLTVEQGRAASHQNKGWEQFTDKVITFINDEKEHVVFILWGTYAQRKGACIDGDKHLILKAVHPSPLSAHRGFFGGAYFSKSNAYLLEHDIEPVDWALPIYGQTSISFNQAK